MRSRHSANSDQKAMCVCMCERTVKQHTYTHTHRERESARTREEEEEEEEEEEREKERENERGGTFAARISWGTLAWMDMGLPASGNKVPVAHFSHGDEVFASTPVHKRIVRRLI